jgi:uridylate kinase
MSTITVISVGGSIVVPDQPDARFIRDFCRLVAHHLAAKPDQQLVLVIGGGAPARTYQQAFAVIGTTSESAPLDRIGIAATRLNAQLVKEVLGALAPGPVVMDPQAVRPDGRVVVAGGWKPGFSTDNVAVELAIKLGAGTVVNLSNIEKVYTADPKRDPSATPIDAIGWDAFLEIVGSEWKPGANLPFDPVASRRAAEAGIRVICAGGRDLPNVSRILSGESFAGTVIGPGRAGYSSAMI